MTVVSDNGPIGFLVQIGREDLLPRLYGEVLIPPAVKTELKRSSTPLEVREWIAAPPGWLTEKPPVTPVSTERRGWGEREATQLAKERGALLLCDDGPGRGEARRQGVKTTGTLGILQAAHVKGWLDIEAGLDELRTRTGFRFPDKAFLSHIVAEAKALRSAALAAEQELDHDLDPGFDL